MPAAAAAVAEVAMGFALEFAAAAAVGVLEGVAAVVAPEEAEVVPPTEASPMEFPHWEAVALNWTNYPCLGSGDRLNLVSVRSFSAC